MGRAQGWVRLTTNSQRLSRRHVGGLPVERSSTHGTPKKQKGLREEKRYGSCATQEAEQSRSDKRRETSYSRS